MVANVIAVPNISGKFKKFADVILAYCVICFIVVGLTYSGA